MAHTTQEVSSWHYRVFTFLYWS